MVKLVQLNNNGGLFNSIDGENIYGIIETKIHVCFGLQFM